MKKLIRTATVSLSLDILLKGQLQFLSQNFDVVAISGQDEHLIEVEKREKVKTIAVTFERKIAPFNDLVSLFKLYRVFKKEKPFIVHSITPKAGLLSMIAGYFAKVPIRIHTFTGLVFPTRTGLMQQLLIVMDKVLCLFATHIYPEGNGVKNDLMDYKITKKALKIIANGNINGIDCDYFNTNHFSETTKQSLKAALKVDPNDFVFIFVGRLVKDKGINELITAFVRFSETNKQVKLLLVGPFEQHLNPINDSTLQKIKENSTIISVGYQNDVRPYYAISNCLVFPSYREGFPNVVLQAGAMNLPCIVTNINGSNEIITNNENGLIIEIKNENAIFEALNVMIIEKQLYEKLKNNARKKIVTNFEQKIVWEAVLDEYKKIENYYQNLKSS